MSALCKRMRFFSLIEAIFIYSLSIHPLHLNESNYCVNQVKQGCELDGLAARPTRHHSTILKLVII